MRSLKKFVTTMSSGWMSLFLIDNYEEIIYSNSVDAHYVNLFKQNEKTVNNMNKNDVPTKDEMRDVFFYEAEDYFGYIFG